jgi:hypothetical protein
MTLPTTAFFGNQPPFQIDPGTPSLTSLSIHCSHRDLQQLMAYNSDQEFGYFSGAEEKTKEVYLSTLVSLVLFLTRMTTAPPAEPDQPANFHPASLPQPVSDDANVLKANPTQTHVHNLLLRVFTPFNPAVPRNEHLVAWFVNLRVRRGQNDYLSLPSLSKLAKGLVYGIRLACFEQITRENPQTEETRTAIFDLVKLKWVSSILFSSFRRCFGNPTQT